MSKETVKEVRLMSKTAENSTNRSENYKAKPKFGANGTTRGTKAEYKQRDNHFNRKSK